MTPQPVSLSLVLGVALLSGCPSRRARAHRPPSSPRWVVAAAAGAAVRVRGGLVLKGSLRADNGRVAAAPQPASAIAATAWLADGSWLFASVDGTLYRAPSFTGLQTVLTEVFATRADYRLLLALGEPQEPRSFADREVFWMDYVSDTGDGWRPTTAVLHALARTSIAVDGEALPRGDLLLMGGDQVYPAGSIAEYEARLLAPMRAVSPPEPPTPRPLLLAIARPDALPPIAPTRSPQRAIRCEHGAVTRAPEIDRGAGQTCQGSVCTRFPSTGAEGAFAPSTNTVLAPGVHNFTTITIPAGVTVTATAGGAGVLDLRATGNVTIAGTINLSGGTGGAHTDCLDNASGAGGGVTGNPTSGASGDACGVGSPCAGPAGTGGLSSSPGAAGHSASGEASASS